MSIRIGRGGTVTLNRRANVRIVSEYYQFSTGITYYVSNTTGNDANNGTSSAAPWQTLSKVISASINGPKIRPGDTVAFKKGETWIVDDTFGGFRWWNNFGGRNCVTGSPGRPITLTNYGTGELPNFLFPTPSTLYSKIAMSFENVSYMIIDGLQFNDTRSAVDKIYSGSTIQGIMLGESGTDCNNNIVRNCYFSNVSLPIVVVGSNNEFYNNTMENFCNAYWAGSDGYGANGFTMTGNYNYVHHNTVSGAWAYSDTFSTNGGALEMINTNNNNTIAFNTFIDCGGIAEWGSNSGQAEVCQDNLFAYNKIINCGGVSFCNVDPGGGFPIEPSNLKWYNNTIVENANSRFSGPNFGAGFTSFPRWSTFPRLPEPEDKFFSNNGSPVAATVWDIRNNIIICTNSSSAPNGSPPYATRDWTYTILGSSKTIHTNNIYKLSSGAVIGLTAGSGEVTSSAQILQDESNADPILWNFSPLLTGPAINAGTYVGLTVDFAGNPVSNPPDAGILEYV